jgi:hypothetical protein
MERSSRDQETIVMLSESFRQLTKLQQECHDELSTFQREKFVAHEEFRNVSTLLFKSIEDFQTTFNTELDKLTLRINRLEIIALHSFDVVGRRLFTCPTARHLACVKHRILISLANGDMRAYNKSTLNLAAELPAQNYDPLGQFNKITQFYAVTKLFVGFSSGIVLAIDVDSMQVLTEMKYHRTPITAIYQHGDVVATGCTDGVVVLWNAGTLARVMIAPFHRLPIVGIIHTGKNWIIADRTGIVTMHDPALSQSLDKYKISPGIVSMFQHGENRVVTLTAQELLMWEGKRVVKTFNAVEIDPKLVCCVKQPELLVLGSQTSMHLRFVFLESLLFPKTIDVLDSPPLEIVASESVFYVLTVAGRIVVVEPGS